MEGKPRLVHFLIRQRRPASCVFYGRGFINYPPKIIDLGCKLGTVIKKHCIAAASSELCRGISIGLFIDNSAMVLPCFCLEGVMAELLTRTTIRMVADQV